MVASELIERISSRGRTSLFDASGIKPRAGVVFWRLASVVGGEQFMFRLRNAR
jgi:hypothetical protein